MDIETIHESLVNGQREQMVKQIKRYGKYDFFVEYKEYLESIYQETGAVLHYFSSATTSFFRITGR